MATEDERIRKLENRLKQLEDRTVEYIEQDNEPVIYPERHVLWRDTTNNLLKYYAPTSDTAYNHLPYYEQATAPSINPNQVALWYDTTNDLLKVYVPTVASVNTIPTGGLIPYGGSVAPSGWLLADGSTVSRTTYSDLFDVYGETYGAGDSSTTFGLPNMAGKLPIGIDAGDTDFDALGETAGAKTHDHPSTATSTPTGTIAVNGTVDYGVATNVHTHTLDLAAIDHMPPVIAVNYIIKT